jgi:methionyl aminopeptidase
MITMGSFKTKLLNDAWTVVTQDGSLAAHFEHTIVITESGPEVLTAPEGAMRGWPAGA